MTLGDVVWIDLQIGGGRAQSGRRPAIVFQSSEIPGAKLPTVLVVPLTSQQAAMRFPGTALISPNATNGLRQPSVALVFQLTAVDLNFVSNPIGQVSASQIEELMQALDELLGQ